MFRRAGSLLDRTAFEVHRRLTTSGRWDHLRSFCLFCGYGRSGHSAVGSLIDAHPDAIVSHELNALKRYLNGVDRDELLAQIAWLSRKQARRGRTSSRASGGRYLHEIDAATQGVSDTPHLIGDKKGAYTTRLLRTHGVATLDEFEDWVGLPLKVLHVVRNPYDMVAAGLARGRTSFFELLPAVVEVRQARKLDAWIDVYYEDLIASPRSEITRICRFLGLTASEAYLNRCADYLYAAPNRRRYDIDWPPDLRDRVSDAIESHSFLNRYTWHE